MRKPMVYSADALPEKLDVIGESAVVFGAEDEAKPFEAHLMQGNKGGGPPPHFHPWDEAFYVLKGELSLVVGEETFHLKQGSFAQIPGGTVHAYTNLADDTILMDISSDSRSGKIFTALSDARIRMPEDLERFLEINEQFGCVFIQGEPTS